MRTIGLLIALLIVPLHAAYSQETEPPEGTIIRSAQVTGLELRKLSPGLQDAIAKLVGQPLSREHLRELAARIEAEQPRYVAALRTTKDPGGEARVEFVAAQRRDEPPDPNVNARYIVEVAEVTGVPEGDIPEEIREALQALSGKRLDSEEAERLETRLEKVFTRYDVTRRVVRGSEAGRIRLVFELRKAKSARWLRFEPPRSNVVYHSEQGWGSYLDLAISSRDVRVTPIVAIDNGDDLVEEYSGFGVRVEARRLGTERLGASFEWTTFDQTWRGATLQALELDPRLPRPYDDRSTFTPVVTFAFTPTLRISAGVSIAELEPVSGSPASQMANAAVASIGFTNRRDGSHARHQVEAAVTLRAGSRSLESDLVYTRYLGQGAYGYRHGRHRVRFSGQAGGITGDAPLFERFSLGDSRTLRGWDKYDIAPAGGDRMFHASVEYRYRALAIFLDSGSVWDAGTEPRFRVATGLGFHPDPVFFTVGVPLNTDELTAVFTMGIRFSGIGFAKY